MKRRIFPDSIINQSTEQLFYENRHSSQILYVVVLTAIICTLASLYFLEVNISVRTSGVIKPRGERSVITAPMEGYVIFHNMAENSLVNKGDMLFVIQSENITSQLSMLQARQAELSDFIYDLYLLTRQDTPSTAPRSTLYKQGLQYYKTQLLELDFKLRTARRNYDRHKPLFDKGVIPASDFDPIEAEYDAAKVGLNVFKSRQQTQWLTDLNSHEVELRDVNTKISQIDIQSRETVVSAPVFGTIQKIENISNGTYVHSGQQVVEISPCGDLLAECYVSPKDIGLLKIGQSGRIQVTAFNYNDWGILTGEINEIFDDIIVSSDQSTAYYKVYCSLDSNHLQLKNGYKGYVKKGMTVNTQFVITRRTLFQLLYDKADKWLNPNDTQNEK